MNNVYGDGIHGLPATWRQRRFTADNENFRLGPARLQQLRIVPGILKKTAIFVSGGKLLLMG